jgi:hypothetical protein
MTAIRLSDLSARYRAGSPRKRFLVAGILPAQGITMVYGPSGAGKTGLAITTAMCVADGLPWAGRETEKGGVLYIAAENYLGVLDRFQAAAMRHGDHRLPIVIADRPSGPIAREKGRYEIAALAREHAAALGSISLIVIDTLATVFGSTSQDDSAGASIFMNELEALSAELGCAVAVVHHTGKKGADMRGSQVFLDRADAVLKVSPRGSGTIVSVEKQRNARSEGAFRFEIEAATVTDGAETISVQVVRDFREIAPLSAAPVAAAAAPSETDRDLMMRVLAEIGGNSVTVSAWQRACFERWDDKSDNAKKVAFSKGRNRLWREEKIAVRGDKVSAKVSGNSGNNPGNQPAEVSVSIPPPPLRGRDGNRETGSATSAPWETPVPSPKRKVA